VIYAILQQWASISEKGFHMKKSFRVIILLSLAMTLFGCPALLSLFDVPVTGVSISSVNSTLAVGAQEQLAASVLPADATQKAVTWTSSDETVAKVDADGLVTGITVGVATVTVATQGGSFTASCEVTVLRADTTDILSFVIPGMSQPANIDWDNKTVVANVPPMDLSTTSFEVGLSVGSTVAQEVLVDGQTSIFVVTNASGQSADWSVTVNVQRGISFRYGDNDTFVAYTAGVIDSSGSNNEWLDGLPIAKVIGNGAELYAFYETYDVEGNGVPRYLSLYIDGLENGQYANSGFEYIDPSGTFQLSSSVIMVEATDFGGRKEDLVSGIFFGQAADNNGMPFSISDGFFKVHQNGQTLISAASTSDYETNEDGKFVQLHRALLSRHLFR
jgi:hypothetical protein